MIESVIIDTRLQRKIESLMTYNNECYSVSFTDLIDTFWFNDKDRLQDFLNNQSAERYYDKELRRGYFDYINDVSDTIRYHVESKRGTLTLLKEECLNARL